MLTQIVPHDLNQDEEEARGHFDRDFNELILLLQQSCSGLLLNIFPAEIHSPYPIGVTLNSFYIMKRVTKAISRALTAVVKGYFKDPRLWESLLAVSPQARALLRLVDDKPYNIGSWRPDILYPADDVDHFKVCEINARFPFNGFYASHEKNNILCQLSYLRDVPMMPVSELDEIPDTFCNVFDRNKSVGVLKSNHEEGWDVKLFQSNSLSTSQRPSSRKRRRGSGGSADPLMADDVYVPPPLSHTRSESKSFPVPVLSPRAISETLSLNAAEDGQESGSQRGARFVFPQELTEGADKILRDSVGPLEQFVFECSADELLGISPELLERIVACPHFNDLRTIFLAHDKRMLSVLSSPDLLRDYASPEDAAILSRHIIPTFVVGVHSSVVREAKEQPQHWILKPNAGGKGVGIVFGRDCADPDDWAALLDNPEHQTYVLQRVVAQQHVDIVTATGSSEMLVVGLLHCFDSNFLGPGIFRASSLQHPIVNVSGGNGVILSPAILSCRWNLSRTALPSRGHPLSSSLIFEIPEFLRFSLDSGTDSAKFNQGLIDQAWGVLGREGIAVIQTPWVDCSSPHLLSAADIDSELLRVVEMLQCVPHSHSSSVGSIWDVRPVHDKVVPTLNETSLASESDAQTGSQQQQQQLHPRSKTAEAFGMHTDCSFESPPPRYILLFVVREDRLGGGYSTLIDTEVLLRYLSRSSLFTLIHSDFQLRVPPEFFKGEATLVTPLISLTEKRFQYRSDIVIREKCTPAQLEALEELDRLLNSPALVLTTLLPPGSLLLLDNTRWFHGRSSILDKERWLKRIRFNARPEVLQSMPVLQRLVSRTDSLQQERAQELEQAECFALLRELPARDQDAIKGEEEFSL